MNSKGSGGKLEGFFTGKGFYIVLFLCAAVIGVSAWMMAAGNRRMAEDIRDMNRVSMDKPRVETVIIPPQEAVQESLPDLQEAAAPTQAEQAVETMAEPESTEVWREEPAPAREVSSVYVWPLEGELERPYLMDALGYDVTMGDWRIHAGIDILAPVGSVVSAAHAGTVEAVDQHDFFGAMVTVNHGDGVRTVYANLEENPGVSVGDWVEPGDTIGAVGKTALCEIGQSEHLHFSIQVNGVAEDPLAYLPA